MGVLDKIKNALFEVEYVEVEEPPKKEKKEKPKKEKKEKKEKEKPIAKKVVLPGKKEKVKEIKEETIELPEEIKEEEIVDEQTKEQFKMLDDKDFAIDEDFDAFQPEEEPEILHVFEDEVVEEPKPEVGRRTAREYEAEEDYYTPPAKEEYVQPESKPYGLDNSYQIPVHEYGTYEKKEERGYFKPSPIISPIYGVLDKNYKKEDVVSKKEVRLTSSYSRRDLNVDDIRNKAYGTKEVIHEESTFEVEDEDSDSLMVDLSDKSKPAVKELTVGDAEEYFEDLGLEYNVDYVDVSKEKPNTKPEDEVEKEVVVPEKVVVKEEKPKEEKKKDIIEDDDNLFDLIDSMYKENS